MNSTKTVANIFGHQVEVFENDHVGKKIEKNGLYEKENLEFILAFICNSPNPVILDIGANIGNHSLAFSTCATQVHAFEPVPAIYSLLDRNIAANGLSNVYAHNLALSDRNGTANINLVTDGNAGASSFDQRRAGTRAVEVVMTTGDEFLASRGVERVDFIKIDVEAHEVFVLRGLMNTLERDHPVITMEWNDQLTIDRLRDSPELAFLQKHYHIHVLGSNYDRGYWEGRSWPFIRRKLTRLLKPRKAVLYPFDPNRLYKNLLLVPREKSHLLLPGTATV